MLSFRLTVCRGVKAGGVVTGPNAPLSGRNSKASELNRGKGKHAMSSGFRGVPVKSGASE